LRPLTVIPEFCHQKNCSPRDRALHGTFPDQARKIVGAHFSPRQALGFLDRGLIRELFRRSREFCSLRHESGERFPPSRRREKCRDANDCPAQKLPYFISLLGSEELPLQLGKASDTFSHWRPPLRFRQRFDTRFCRSVGRPKTNSTGIIL